MTEEYEYIPLCAPVPGECIPVEYQWTSTGLDWAQQLQYGILYDQVAQGRPLPCLLVERIEKATMKLEAKMKANLTNLLYSEGTGNGGLDLL